MKVENILVQDSDRLCDMQRRLQNGGSRIGCITSIDGSQIVTLLLNTVSNSVQIITTPLAQQSYRSITPHLPQAHWQERTLRDMFGLIPEGHPRLKHNVLHEEYKESFFPLSLPRVDGANSEKYRAYEPMEIRGSGILEIPVGPIHAGIIEPGHFRFSCLGEIIFNLEIRLGYTHRGVESQMLKTALHKQRFLAESAASDSAVAYAFANATVYENLFDTVAPERAQYLRTICLEIERVSMHLNDVGGLAGDIGYLAVSSSLGRLRGIALHMAELISGSRLLRGFVCPGGVVRDSDLCLGQVDRLVQELKHRIQSPFDALLTNQVVIDRMDKVGRVSKRLASDFGLVGPAARASGIEYDARKHFAHGVYPQQSPELSFETGGDVLSRAKVRIREVMTSLDLIAKLISDMPSGKILEVLPESLPKGKVGVSIIEAHRGELIHMAFTDDEGNLIRYVMKDPSVNNWTALAISVRNNLLADFPLCNKSFGLSYSGHDL